MNDVNEEPDLRKHARSDSLATLTYKFNNLLIKVLHSSTPDKIKSPKVIVDKKFNSSCYDEKREKKGEIEQD